MSFRLVAGVAVGVLLFVATVSGQEKKPEIRAKLEGHRGGVTAITFSYDGTLIATGAGNGMVFLWDAKSGNQLGKLDGGAGNTVTGLTLSQDNATLAVASKGYVGTWNVSETRAPKAAATLANSSVRYPGVGTTGDGAAFVTVPAYRVDYTAKLEFIGIKGQGASSTVAGPERLDPRALACAPETDTRATAVYGGINAKDAPAVCLFGLGDVKTITRGVPPFSKEGPHHIGYSPEGKWLGVCSGQFVVWKVPGSQIIGGEPLNVTFDAYAAAIGPKDIAVTSSLPSMIEGTPADLTFWKLGTEVKKLAVHKTDLADVRCLAFSPDGTTLAVCGYTDGVVQLWRLGDDKKREEK